ncbi:HNH endonuclease [Photobacterium leiognathi]|uniref:HNH endonuclease n=1 Tax=Photobacterium leiognathi TaxID=553611 RepID=UPI001EE09E3B|nr:HNH endonuclease [Photobacterium leiognathi]
MKKSSTYTRAKATKGGEKPTYFFESISDTTLLATREWDGVSFSFEFKVGQRFFTQQKKRLVEITSLQDHYHELDCGYYFKTKNVNQKGTGDLTAQSAIDDLYHGHINGKDFVSPHEINIEHEQSDSENTVFIEGSVTVNRYERDPAARAACIEHYGCYCQVCGFDFLKVYGALGLGYIEVHHIKPLHEIKSAYIVDPIKDLIPLCANCHSMIHRSQGMTVEILKAIVNK